MYVYAWLLASSCAFGKLTHLGEGGGGGTPYNGLYGEAPPERGTFFRLRVYRGVGISQVEEYKRLGNR